MFNIPSKVHDYMSYPTLGQEFHCIMVMCLQNKGNRHLEHKLTENDFPLAAYQHTLQKNQRDRAQTQPHVSTLYRRTEEYMYESTN